MRKVTLMMVATLVFAATASLAQESEHKRQPESRQQVSMSEQLAELRSKVARLEAALEQQHRGKKDHSSHSEPSTSGMGKEMMKKQMGSDQGKDMGMKKGMSMGGMGKRMMGGKGMRMMGKMSAPVSVQPSSLPGFPGISHLYHIGASAFFLDHGDHLELLPPQRRTLGELQEKSTLEQATLERNLAQTEQDLWVLTGADTPDSKKIEAKLRQIADLQVKQRMGFIRAIGKSANVLTDAQRKLLLGEPHAATPGDKPDHSNH